MKKLMVVIVASVMALGASAQHYVHGYGGGGHVYIAPPVVSVGMGYSPFYYAPFGYAPYYGYNNVNGYPYRPSKLDMKIADLKQDYEDKINSAKNDNSISGKERKKIVKQLKNERDQAIDDLKRNYYKQS